MNNQPSLCFAERMASPVGDLWLVVDEVGALLELLFDEGKHASPDEAALERRLAKSGLELRWDSLRLDEVRTSLEEYFDGRRRSFDLPLAPRGTDFQQRVWTELQRIPYGTTSTYGALAANLGQPTASRAVGLANGKNPISIVIPCHRVIGSDGSLTGYAGGLHKKEALLKLEGSLLF